MKATYSEIELTRLRRKILWRAQHRGTRELDILIGGYAEKKVPSMLPFDLERFANFLTLSENDLQERLLRAKIDYEDPFRDLIEDIRELHLVKENTI